MKPIGNPTAESGASYVPEALAATRLDLDVAEARCRDFLSLMLERRSVCHFSDEPVPRVLLENALEVAASPPSGANRQPWRFVVVEDPAVKARIRRAAEREEELLYRERASRSGPTGTNRISRRLRY
jgi:iodotyrosine deiodinase